MPWLINTTQLDKFRKNQKNLVILDVSLHHDGRDAKAEFEEKHIVNAQFLDLKEFCDTTSDLPNTILLDEKLVSEKLSRLGIRNDYKIIFYDNSALHTSCRALWLFKVFGHNPQLLYVLDGGFAAYEKNGGKIESGSANFSAKSYQANIQKQYLSFLDHVKNNVVASTAQVVDLRHPVRYAGGPESRPGLRSGHIPGSFCLPFYILFNKDGTFISQEKLKKKFIEIGITLNAPIITTCGSGTTAPILNFLLDLIPNTQHTLYDGSWSEWGAVKLYPGESDLSERPVVGCLE